MKKILWALSVVLIMVIATGASADIRSEKCNTCSNDLGISSVLDNCSGDTCVLAGSIADEQNTNNHYTNKDKNACLLAAGEGVIPDKTSNRINRPGPNREGYPW